MNENDFAELPQAIEASAMIQTFTNMNELIFFVEAAPKGGFTARALGAAIFTEADDAEGLREQVCDAMRCHFDHEQRPRVIRFRFACGDAAA